MRSSMVGRPCKEVPTAHSYCQLAGIYFKITSRRLPGAVTHDIAVEETCSTAFGTCKHIPPARRWIVSAVFPMHLSCDTQRCQEGDLIRHTIA